MIVILPNAPNLNFINFFQSFDAVMAKSRKRAIEPGTVVANNKRPKQEETEIVLPPLTDLTQSAFDYFNHPYFFREVEHLGYFASDYNTRDADHENKKLLTKPLNEFFLEAQKREEEMGLEAVIYFLGDCIHGGISERLLIAYKKWGTENNVGINDDEDDPPRMVSVAYDIHGTQLSHKYDLDCFSKHVNSLFKTYHGTEIKTLIGPYFCFVQSSGMGKTKIMYEYKRISSSFEKDPVDSFLIVPKEAIKSDLVQGKKVFDFYLDLALPKVNEKHSMLERAQKAAQAIFIKLDQMVEKLMKKRGKRGDENNDSKRMLLMFDESQKLLKEEFGYKAFRFRCIRIWLREIPPDYREKYVIAAVFTGTNSELTNFEFETDDELKKPSGPDASREWVDQANYYPRGRFLFPPFFQTTTIGSCLSLLKKTETEYDRAVYYGRPLFARMATTNELDDRIGQILLRMIRHANWTAIRETWVNLFATRVQLGETTAELASRLVADKYANFCGYNNDTKAIYLGYLPDPVCARLAMCMMDEKFKLKMKNESIKIKGKGKKWWSEVLMTIFSSGIVSPEKGDFGEVIVALYMLFSGDELRKLDNKGNGIHAYRKFSVSLDDWLQAMFLGGTIPRQAASSSEGASIVSVGFIQVCRNHLRTYSHSWKSLQDQGFLKRIFESGSAFYACNNCPLIDMVVPLRIKRKKKKVCYAPLLVSVKCHINFSQARAEQACLAMAQQAADDQLGMALCLLIVFGCEDDNAPPFVGDIAVMMDGAMNVSKLLETGAVVSKAIRIPAKEDKFGLTDAFHAMTSTARISAELFVSHPYLKLHGPETEENKDSYVDLKAERALRRKAPKEWKENYTALREAMVKNPDGSKGR